MKSFFSGLWLGTKALFTKPLQYITDPVGTTTAMYKADLEAEGASIAEIDQAVKAFEDSGGPVTDVLKGYGSATKALGNAAKSVGKALDFLGNNFTVVLVVVLLIVAGWYFLMFRKAAA